MNKLAKLLAVLVFALNATAANAASRVWISEFGTLGNTPAAPAQIAPLPSLTNQSTLDLTAGGGAAQTSAAFGNAP